MGINKEIASRKKIPKKNKYSSDDIQLYTLCIIPMVLVFIFNYLPMAGIILAFKDYKYDKGILGSNWVGLYNFKFFFESNEFLKLTRNTLLLNGLFIIAGIAAALLIAILLFCLRGRKNIRIYQTLMITPHFISWVVVSYMVYAFLSPQHGIVNNILENFGMEKVDWYNTPMAWPIILTVSGVWKNVGMDCIIYYAALMNIDSTLFEAADVDGANTVEKIKNIIIPALKPLLTVLTILKIGGILRSDFGMFYQLTRDVGALYDITDVIDTYTYRVMSVIGNLGMGTAIGLLQSGVGMILVFSAHYISKKIDSELGLF